tara:strand:- start:4381 stop:4875 length:495 start_codon:yes stop_codon:yes gene_type:complete
MKYRISDTDIIDLQKVDFIEVDGRSINFHINSNVHQSVYNNDLESTYVFNNIVSHFDVVDLRFQSKEKKVTINSRKEKGFEMFWNLYDKRVDKIKAKKSWMNLTLNEMGDAIKAVKTYVESTPDKQYRRMPATWINNKSWKNDIKLNNKKTNRYVKPQYIQDER